jgi:hypothetical protein
MFDLHKSKHHCSRAAGSCLEVNERSSTFSSPDWYVLNCGMDSRTLWTYGESVHIDVVMM